MKNVLCILLFLLVQVHLSAQIVIHEAPTEVVRGMTFCVAYDVLLPDVLDFTIAPLPDGVEEVMEPFYSVVEVKGKRYTQYTVTLCATEAGEYVLPAPRALTSSGEVCGKECLVHAKAADELIAESTIGSTARGGVTEPTSSKQDATVFVIPTINKSETRVNEPVCITYAVYSQGSVEQLRAAMPEIKGCVIVELPVPDELEATEEAINGTEYKKVEWCSYVIYPLQVGAVNIPSLMFSGQVRVKQAPRDAFDAVLHPLVPDALKDFMIEAPRQSFVVTPLPASPVRFSGGIGRFSLSAAFTSTAIKAGEVDTLRLTIRGVGNFRTIKHPTIGFPADFDTFDVRIIDHTQLTPDGYSGDYILEYPFVPINIGSYNLPPIKLIYFDVAKEEYVTLNADSLCVRVEAASLSMDSFSSMRDIYQDAHGLGFWNSHLRDMGAWAYTLVLVLSILMCGGTACLVIRYRRKRSSPELRRKRISKKVAMGKLKRLKKLEQELSEEDFYSALSQILRSFIAAQFLTTENDLQKRKIIELLQLAGIDEKEIAAFSEVFASFEAAQFGKINQEKERGAVIEDVNHLIKSLDKMKIRATMT